MPWRAKMPCGFPGCPQLIEPGTGGYCDEHKRAASYDDRGSSAERGYGNNWRKIRGAYLKKHPLCADPYGMHEEDGRVVVANEVHHIIPKAKGGRDNWDNLMSLCKSCHSKITMENQRYGT